MTEQEWAIAIVSAWHEAATTEPRELYVEWLARNHVRAIAHGDTRKWSRSHQYPAPPDMPKMGGRLLGHPDGLRYDDPIFVVATPWAVARARPDNSRRFCAACMIPVSVDRGARELLQKENARLVCVFCYTVTRDVFIELEPVTDRLLSSREPHSGTEAVQ